MIEVSLFTTKPAGVPPKLTAVAPVRCAPVIVTVVPPYTGPVFGLTSDTDGAATNVNRSLALVALAPPEFVTITSTVPALVAGATAVIDMELFTVKLVAGVPPKLTPVAPVNPVPVIVIVVPPVAGPETGDTAVILAAGTNPGARARKALPDWL